MNIPLPPGIVLETDDEKILNFILADSGLVSQLESSKRLRETKDVVWPLVMRASPQEHHFDLHILVHHLAIESDGHWLKYTAPDFIRQKTDLSGLVNGLYKADLIHDELLLKIIRAQIKLLNRPEMLDLKYAPAQMVKLFLQNEY